MLKELHLVARTIYSLLATFGLSGLSGLSFLDLVPVLPTVFINSFIFQYLVLHLVMKKITTSRNRLFFLLGWFVVCLIGLIVTGIKTDLNDIIGYASFEDFAIAKTLWASMYIIFSAMLVAGTCARRAFTRYGALG